MRITINLDFSNDDDKLRFERFLNARRMAKIIEEFTNELRQKVKYTNEIGSWAEAQEMFYSLISSYNYNDDDTILD